MHGCGLDVCTGVLIILRNVYCYVESKRSHRMIVGDAVYSFVSIGLLPFGPKKLTLFQMGSGF